MSVTLLAEPDPMTGLQTAQGCPRDFLDNRFVYVVVSSRAQGLSLGVNMNPDRHCNFDCAYCEVGRHSTPLHRTLDVDVMAGELRHTLDYVLSGEIRMRSVFADLPPALLRPKHVALSGDGEPTLSPLFEEAVEAVVHLRARGLTPFFKMVLVTNGTGLDLPAVSRGLRFFTSGDDIWVKLDVGTQSYMDRVNRSEVPLKKVLANILALGRQRSITIQSLFPSIEGVPPSAEEIAAYVQRIKELRDAGARISNVQIYSATRPTPHSGCGHLPLRTLSRIALAVRQSTGLQVDVY